MDSASYLLILTYDKSAAAPDHITLTHFLGSLINPVPSISKSPHVRAFAHTRLTGSPGNPSLNEPILFTMRWTWKLQLEST
jgi:hypothetical protein